MQHNIECVYTLLYIYRKHMHSRVYVLFAHIASKGQNKRKLATQNYRV